MSTPFTHAMSTATTSTDATDAQIVRAIVPLLTERKWGELPNAKFVSRIALLNLVIGWAMAPMADETPAEVSRVIPRGASYGARVNAILAHLRSITDESAGNLYAPLTKSGASALISGLHDVARIATAAPKAVDGTPQGYIVGADVVPAGRYAIDTQSGAVNTIAFYKVDRPTEGRWAGYVFVKLITGDEERRLNFATSKSVLTSIAAVGAQFASARYGHEIGECGICGRQLTNDESRARGIGPVCAEKMGW